MDPASLQRVSVFSAVCLISSIESRYLDDIGDLLLSTSRIAQDSVSVDLRATRRPPVTLPSKILLSRHCTFSALGDAVPTANLQHVGSATICSKLRVPFEIRLPDTSKQKPGVGIYMSMLVTVSYCMTYLRNEVTLLARKDEVSDE